MKSVIGWAIVAFVLVWAGMTLFGTEESVEGTPAPAGYSDPLYPTTDVYRTSEGEYRLSDAHNVSAGVCRTFYGPEVTVYSCVPMLSPDGGHVLYVEEDSSARYSDGWVMDSESDQFYRP